MTSFLDLAVETPRGLVDLVAVDRVLSGVPTVLTAAERSYALTQLARSLAERSADVGGGKWNRHDPRILDAAAGFETTPELMRDRIQQHRNRHGLQLPADYAPNVGRARGARGPLPVDCHRCGKPMPVGDARRHGCLVCKVRRARERRQEKARD